LGGLAGPDRDARRFRRATGDGGARGLSAIAGDDLVGDLAPVDVDAAREVERDTNPVSLDRRDADDADGVVRVADDDLLPFASCDHQHLGPPVLTAAEAVPPGGSLTRLAKGRKRKSMSPRVISLFSPWDAGSVGFGVR